MPHFPDISALFLLMNTFMMIILNFCLVIHIPVSLARVSGDFICPLIGPYFLVPLYAFFYLLLSFNICKICHLFWSLQFDFVQGGLSPVSLERDSGDLSSSSWNVSFLGLPV